MTKEEKIARKLQKKLIKLALKIAKTYDYKLDYSNASIETVEYILGDIHKEYKKTKNSEGLYGIAMEFGCYIVAVIEKNYGKGRLEINHEEFGENVFPFYYNDITLFPIQWCQKRIYDGKGDNVVFKYQQFANLCNDCLADNKKNSFWDIFKLKGK